MNLLKENMKENLGDIGQEFFSYHTKSKDIQMSRHQKTTHCMGKYMWMGEFICKQFT